MKISFSAKASPRAGAVIVGVEDGRKLTPAAQEVDKATRGAVSRAVKSGRFSGKRDQTLHIAAPSDVAYDRILLVGLGSGLGPKEFLKLGGAICAEMNSIGEKEAVAVVDAGSEDLAEAAANLANGCLLRSYRFDRYMTKEKAEAKPTFAKLTVQSSGTARARKLFKDMAAVGEGVFLTRDLVSEPPNVLYPVAMAEGLKDLEKVGVKVEIFGEKQLEKLGMRALLGVGQGSVRESQVVVMQWNGGGRNKQPVAFIGKGVTFDTGGISIKPAQGMEEMKWDMGGAGVVAGLMKSLAARKAKVNAVGLVGLVENMPDGAAQRPGDIVTSLSGQTIEIHNTDAEGRLVLADVLWYAKDRFKPRFMVDLATLTGAIIIALGHEHAGLFANDDELAARLTAAGEATDERVWRMPLAEAYDKQLTSDVADMKNIGGRSAGSITAAQFLKRFVNETPWAHLDIAGVTWSSKDKPTAAKGATGFGVRLLDRLVADHYEG